MIPLWQHQKDAIARASDKFALFFDPGCGKTRTAIEIFKTKQHYTHVTPQKRISPSIKKCLILAPLNVCRNWERELDLFYDRPYATFLVAGQSKGKKVKTLTEFRDYHDNKTAFLICNIEAMRSKEYLSIIQQCEIPFVIVDEAHNFKTHNSLQTRGLISTLGILESKYVLLLTGTPAPQGEIDLWSTFYILDVTKDNFFIWRKKYFIDKNERRRGMRNYWPDYSITTAARDFFQAKLSEVSVSAKKNLVLDLPPFLRTQMYAELSPEQRRHYNTMKEFLFAIDADGNELNAANFLSRSLRLQQIVAGYLGDVPIKENPRLDVLKDAIHKTNGEQFLVWTIFQSTYKEIGQVLDKLGVSFGLLTGEQSADERFRYMEDFQAGKLRALIAHPKAGGVGVNLTAASYSIHYLRNYSLTDDLQAEARNYRGGSERHNRITRIDIISPDTIDEDIADALREKKSIHDFILDIKQRRHSNGNGCDE